jgi:hypothetical protein
VNFSYYISCLLPPVAVSVQLSAVSTVFDCASNTGGRRSLLRKKPSAARFHLHRGKSNAGIAPKGVPSRQSDTFHYTFLEPVCQEFSHNLSDIHPFIPVKNDMKKPAALRKFKQNSLIC